MKRKLSFGALTVFLLVALFAPLSNAHAASIHYATPSGLTSGDCSTWATACTLTYAITQAVSGDEIWVAQGIHKPGAARTDYFNLKSGLAMYGGFPSTGTPTFADRDPDMYLTILSGDVSGDDTNTNGVVTDYTDIDGDDNNYRVVIVASSATSATVLDGFTITAANADDNGAHYDGGGIVMYWGAPTFNNLHITGNYAYRFGGGMYIYNSNPSISNSVFLGNGAEYLDFGAGGGGIYTNGGSPVITNVDFIRNRGQMGGAIEKDGGTLTIINGGFYGNSADDGANAIYSIYGTDFLTNVAFVGNTGPTGAVTAYGSNITITNGTFTANTIGIYCAFSPTLTLVNSIFYPDYFYNCSSYTTFNHTSIEADPGFVRNPSSGTDGTWGTEDDDYGDLNLRPTSSIIDSGNNNATYLAGVTTDLEGKPRFMDVTTVADTGEGTAPIVDRGAYESTGIAPDLTSSLANDTSGEVTYGDSFTWTVTVTNTGTMTASFTTGQIILTDYLPSSGATYGSPVVQNTTGITGTIGCNIASNTLSCSADGAVVIDDSGGKFDVAFQVTPTTPGALTNPHSGGSCRVDPNSIIIETNESNNTCSSDTVNVIAPDLVVSKVNDVSGSLSLGDTFTWTLTITNTDPITANFTSAQVILQDDLPSSGATYGAPLVQNASGITGVVDCSIASHTLTCSADGAVTMNASGSKFEVAIPVTPTAVGTLANPRSSGSCKVDPNGVIIETDETNNDCNSDTVTVNKAASTLVAEIHDTDHNLIFYANLGDLIHGQATVSGPTGIVTPTGTITLTIHDNDSCSGAPVTSQTRELFNGTAESSSIPAVSFYYKVAYSGDEFYLTDTTDCTLFLAMQPGPTFTVNTIADDLGDESCTDVHCTLREAIIAANEMAADNTILFDVGNHQTLTIASNLPTVNDEGGALTIDGETHHITVSGNHLHRVFDIGSGGINLTLQNITVADGFASTGGGINLGSSSYLTLTQVTVFSNTATTDGAGLYINSSSNAILINVTFSRNRATNYGGAIYNNTGSLGLNNVTLSLNSSSGSTLGGYLSGEDNSIDGSIGGNTGAGIYQTGGSLIIHNSVLWNNSVGQIEVTGANPIQFDNNVIQDGCPAGVDCVNVISTNPLLGELGDYGGSSPTFPLLPGSSAIDANNGNNACADSDQRGITRPQNGICDFGAFESQGFILGNPTGTPQHTTIETAFTHPLALAVTANGALDPVAGGMVTFTPPSFGASAILSSSLVTITASGVVSTTATANSTAGGPYNVVASASGADSVNFSLTNDKAPATVNLSNLNQTYDGTPKPVTVDTVPVSLTVDVTYNGSATVPTNAGAYTVVGTIDETNFQGVATDTLTISTRPITVTAVTDSKPYNGDISSTGVPTITAGSLAIGDTAVWTQTFDTKDVGTGKTLTPQGAIDDGNDGDNYDVTYVPVTTGVISAIDLTVKASDTIKYYLDPLPTFTAVYTGFVNSETVDDLGGSLLFTTTATQTSPIGDYDVEPYGLTSTNYNISFQKGVLHIVPMSDLELTISASADPTLAGANLGYTLVATNHGPSDATQVVITDTLPAKTTLTFASAACSENLGVITCNPGSLASGASVTYTIGVNVSTTMLGAMSNSAIIAGDEEDDDTENNTASVSVQVVPYIVVYDDDFEDEIGDYWCSTVITSATPTGSRRFLGEFDTQEDVCLSIPNLNEHTLVNLSFDLFVIRSWDGDFNDGLVGADRWRLSETRTAKDAINTLLDTTFSNWPVFTQSYPGSFPADQNASLAGADEINTLGYLWGTTPMDSVYNMQFTFDHNVRTLNLDFAALGLQDITDESWGLDNIKVIISAGAEFLPNSVFMPVLIR